MEELKAITGRFSKLKYDIQTDKAIVEIQDKGEDVQGWTDSINKDRKVG